MESTDNYRAFVESPSDWEGGNAAMPAGRMDYSRTSPPATTILAPEDEANSDLGNLGRDVVESRSSGETY